VHFVVLDGSFTLAEATIEEAEAYWEAHRPDPVTLEADLEREGLPLFSDVGFEDALAIGVKAANLAELHNLLPDVAPAGFAVPFRYYAEFLASNTLDAPLCAAAHADCVTEGRDTFSCDGARALCDGAPPSTTLADYAARLVADPGFGSDTALRDAALDGLRYAIRNSVVSPVFAAALDGRVQQVFGAARVRLRSSTNAEDLPRFSGAGLYDSYSAGGADDLPSDEIRKVWASAWNFRAFEERSYWGVDHAGVAMGVAVSASYPDERANGALITQNIADPSVAGMYVNVQAGEMPVTNPEDGAIPEIFSILPGDSTGEVQVARLSYSSLSPSTPLLSTAEVLALHQAATAVQEHMAVLYEESPYSLALDIEFKFTGPERRLILKQVRPFAGY
jgi:hypothetical protein